MATTSQQYFDAALRADAAGDSEAARRLVQAGVSAKAAEERDLLAQEQARPLPRMEPRYPTFAPTSQVEGLVREAVAKKAREEVAARAPVLPPEASISELRAAREKEARKVAEAARARTIQPGVERPVEPGTLPIFRPTRIETVPMVRLPRDLQDDLVSIDEEFVPAEEAYKYGPYDEEALLSEQAYFADEQRRRMYRDPETGELRPPTIQEEFIESFAQQTEVPEARFRAEAMERDLQQRKIDEAVARGEDVPFYNRYLAPATYGILTSERQGKGLVETPLGATLRAGLGYVEAAAAEGAFRAFGYEVDENGVPVDPDDTALALKRAREWAGLPEVAYPLQTLGVAARNITTALGAEPETAKRVEEAFKGAVPLPTPLPGFATEREQAKTTPFDPEGVRRVGSEKAPDPLTEPKAALDFYARKVTENVAKGRTFADEWYDTPVMRDYFASTLGDGDWAFYAGMVPSVFTPAGPGTATRLVGKTVSTATDLAKLSDKAKALQAVEQAAEDLRRVPRTLETGGANPEWKALNSRLEDLTRQASAEVSPGVVRKVAESAVKLAVPEQAAANKFIAAIQDPTNKVETVADLYKLAGKLADSGVTPEAVSQVARLTLRNTPDDYVLLSDAIAVPRSMAAQLKPQFERARKGLFLSSATNMKNKLGELVRGRGLPPDHPLAVAARKLQDKLPTANPGRTYFADLSEDLQNELRTFVRSTAARAGKDPDAAFKAFINNAPPAYGPLKLVGEGGRIFRSWDEVPAALRRQAVDAHDVAIARELRQARRASELTRAQIYFDSAEQSLGAAKFFDSPFVRKLRALVGVQHQETLAAARTANEIRRAGQTSLRDMRALFGKKLQETGDVDLALNAMLREQLTQAGESSGKAWDVLYTLLYGERTKDAALAAAEARVPGLMDEFPTLDAVRALDKQLADDKVVLGMLTPDFEAAFLKVTLDEGLRKNLSKVRRDIFLSGAARSFVDNVPLGELVEFGASNNALRNADELLARQGKLLPFTSGVGAKVIPDAMGLPRTFVYDVAASQVEKAIAEGMGEGLFQVLDDIPVQARADTVSYARDTLEAVLGTWRRNVQQRWHYGWVVPNLLTMGGRLLSMAIIPVTTIGAFDTLAASGRGATRALNYAREAVGLRRTVGGGITTPEGVYYSPQVLEDLGRSYGLGVTQLETERVGTLARELMAEVNRQRSKVPKVWGLASRFDPRDKGFFVRVAEAMELGFRKSVFEMALARGDVPSEAAELARKSQFDYSRTPDFVQQQLGQYVGESAALYQATTEALLKLRENPQAATAILKANRQKAEAQDPYNIHGDKALKSLGIVTLDDKSTYYLPETPILRPVEAVLGAARRADLLASDIVEAYKLEGALNAAYAATVGTGGMVVRTLGDILLPSVVEAYDRFDEGDEYITTGVPDAAPMSDEKVFWTLALAAHLRDPQHEPGGDWSTFVSYFDPVVVDPPAEQTTEYNGKKYWTRQPPEGTPHVYMGMDEKGRRLYTALKPSAQGMRNIKLMRTVTPQTLERLLPLYTTLDFEKGAAPPKRGPYEVYAEPLVPKSRTQAAMDAVLPRVEMTPEQVRLKQAEGIRSVREQIKVD